MCSSARRGHAEATTGREVQCRGGTDMGEAWIIDAVRTPRGRGKKDVGALVHTHPQELLATTLRALARRNTIDVRDVDDVVVGCVSQAGDQGACIARSAVLLAQWPQEAGWNRCHASPSARTAPGWTVITPTCVSCIRWCRRASQPT